MNTVHAADVSGAAWNLAEWMSNLGRKEADVLAGEDLPSNDKSKIKEGEGHNLPEPGKKLVAPLFNLVSCFSFHLVWKKLRLISPSWP